MSALQEAIDNHPLEQWFSDFFYGQILYAKKIFRH